MTPELLARRPEKPHGLLWRIPGPIGLAAYRRVKASSAPKAITDFRTCLESLSPGDICIDLGAHHGKFTEMIARTGALVYAVEPDPINFARLSERVGSFPNVICHEAAVGLGTRPLRLLRARRYDKRPEGRSMASSVVRGSPFAMDHNNFVEVAQLNLLEFLSGLSQPPALIKMDVEGAEWPLLDAIIDSDVYRFGALFVETHERFAPFRKLPQLARLHQLASQRTDRYVNLYWQ